MAEAQVDPDVQTLEDDATQCPYCEEAFEEGQPQTELPCHHRYHTACFFQATTAYPHDGINQRECRICHEPFGEIHEEDTYMNQQIQQLRNRWDTDAEFRKDVKNYMKLQRNADKAQRALNQHIHEKKTERNEQIQSLKIQLQAIYDILKEDIKSSESYKESGKSQRKAMRGYKNLLEKYNIHQGRWILRRALEGRPGLRRWPRSRHRYFGGELRWALRRALKFQIKW